MGLKFWLVRFLTAFSLAFIVIVTAQFFKNNNLAFELTQGLIWAPITATVYVSALAIKFHKNLRYAVEHKDK